MPQNTLLMAVLALETGSPLRERDFQRAVEAEAANQGFDLLYHVKDSRLDQRRGFPDLFAGKTPNPEKHEPGRLIIAELKVPPNKPTREQTCWLRLFSALGLETYIWYPKDWQLIKRILSGAERHPGECPPLPDSPTKDDWRTLLAEAYRGRGKPSIL